jgi:hypothetical protein
MPRAKRQPDLPGDGFSRTELPEVEEPAEDVRILKLERAGLNEKVRAAQIRLLEAMQASNLTIHKYMDADNVPRVARVKEKPSVSVERDKSAQEADVDDADAEADVH